jgi:hypothetical protein
VCVPCVVLVCGALRHVSLSHMWRRRGSGELIGNPFHGLTLTKSIGDGSLSGIWNFRRRPMSSIDGFSRSLTPSDILVVVLHGYLGSPETIRSLVTTVVDEIGPSDTFVPKLPLGLFSFGSLEEIVAQIIVGCVSELCR